MYLNDCVEETIRESHIFGVTNKYIMIPEFCLIYYRFVDINSVNMPREMLQFINHVSFIATDLHDVTAAIYVKMLEHSPSMHPRGNLS
jgi:hypothetical protein